jgi:hypothetical protein
MKLPKNKENKKKKKKEKEKKAHNVTRNQIDKFCITA